MLLVTPPCRSFGEAVAMASGGRLVVIGAGGHAKVVISTLQAAGHEVEAVFDDDPRKHGTSVLGVPVEGPPTEAVASGSAEAILAIGDNRTRKRFSLELALSWTVAVHPESWVHSSVELGPGSVVLAGAILQPGSIIGAHAIVNTASSVDHDCRIHDFVHVAPGSHIAGGATLGEGSLIGIGCSVVPDVSVGAWCTVGAGAAVVSDVPNAVTAVGVPARVTDSAKVQ